MRSDKRLLGANARHKVLDETGRLLGDEPIEPALTHRENREDLFRDASRIQPRLSQQRAQQSAARDLLLDPRLETADIDLENNTFPRKPIESRFQIFKQRDRPNPMQEAKSPGEIDKKKKEEEDESGASSP